MSHAGRLGVYRLLGELQDDLGQLLSGGHLARHVGRGRRHRRAGELDQTPVAAVLLGLRDHPGALTLATSGSSFTTGGVSGYSTRVFSLWRNTSGVGQVLTAANTASPTSATVTFPALNLTTMNATVGRFYLSATNAGLSSTSNLDEVAFLFANWDPARVWTHADGGQSGRLTRNLVSASASLSASVSWGSFLVELLPKVAWCHW